MRRRSGAGAEQPAAVITYPDSCAEWVWGGGECDCGWELLQPDEAVGADEERVLWVRVGEVRDAGGEEREKRAAGVRGHGAEEGVGETYGAVRCRWRRRCTGGFWWGAFGAGYPDRDCGF